MTSEDSENDRARLFAAFEQSQMSVTILDGPEHRLVMSNLQSRLATGTAILGKTAREIVGGRTNPMIEALDRVYATGVAETISAQPAFVHGDQHPGRYFTRILSPLRNDGGSVYGILITAYEVTEEVMARHAHAAELQRIVSLLEEAPVLIAIVEGPELRIDRMNRKIRDLLGSEPIGLSLRDYIPAGNPMLLALERVYATGAPETLEIHSQLAQFHGRSFTTSIVPIHDRQGAIAGLIVTAVEITEQLRARSALEEQALHLEAARQQAVEAGQAKDQFLAMLGHELRNPLAPMVTALQVMRQEGTSSPALDLLERQVAHVTRLVDDLLDISRVTGGKVLLEKRDLELARVIERALEMTSPLLEQRGHHIETDLVYTGLYVAGDADRLAQVIANLLTNAAKYSEPGSRIRIIAERIGDRVQLSVADQGCGIAHDMLATVFDAFVQQPQTLERSHGGLGLGLAIAKNLVEAHGGTIRAHSDGLGKGSTFLIELPAIDSIRPHIVKPPRRAEVATTPRRILIVDDNREAADILRIALEAYGHEARIAHDGPSALEVARTFDPQLGLLDIGLPVMDGYRLAQLLLASHDIPLVAVTGYGQASDRQRTLDAGFVSHLVKPVDLHDLARLVDELCVDNPPRART